jgi:hypothetical protein
MFNVSIKSLSDVEIILLTGGLISREEGVTYTLTAKEIDLLLAYRAIPVQARLNLSDFISMKVFNRNANKEELLQDEFNYSLNKEGCYNNGWYDEDEDIKIGGTI